MQPDSLLINATDAYQAGHLAQAEELILSYLKSAKDSSDGNYLLGLINIKNGHPSKSLHFFSKALDINPTRELYWLAYINALDQSGQTEMAKHMLEIAKLAGLNGASFTDLETCLSTYSVEKQTITATDSIANQPKQAEIDETIQHYHRGEFKDCISLTRSLLQRFPKHGNLWKILGTALGEAGKPKKAYSAMTKASQFLPHDPELSNNMGVTLLGLGETSKAINHFTEAIANNPDYVEAFCNLSTALKNQRKLTEAENILRQALKVNPNHAPTYNNLGTLLNATSQLSEAESCLKKALKISPDFAKAHYNLGIVYQAQGEIEQSETCYRKALKINPDYSDAYDGLLFVSNYHPYKTDKELFALYQEYNHRFGIPNHKFHKPHKNNQDLNRPLRIGYVAPSFYNHPVFNFLKPLFSGHNRNKFDIFAYAEVTTEDQATLYCKNNVDHWISTIGLTDGEMSERIRSDKIDILVDIAGHTGQNRLAVFARKPAPVSIHWLDYGYTTGLTAIDYYLTDLQTTPIGSDNLFSEQLWRLPVPPFMYQPTKIMGQCGQLPAKQNGYITFASLTRAVRLNERTIKTWADILKKVPASRLIIDSNNFKDPVNQDSLKQRFFKYGIDPNRLEIGYHSPPWDTLRKIDITLDCFPHNSGTTLFESLYMGIPYVSYANRPGVGTLGSSILAGIGRSEWIAYSEKEYISYVISLASDINGLEKIRAGLRQEMLESPVMNNDSFIPALENAYREMFQTWVENKNLAPDQTKQSRIPKQAQNLYNRAVDYQEQNQTDKAKATYIQSLNINPDFVEIYNNLGVLFQQTGELKSAEQCLQYAINLLPEYKDAWFNLANNYKLQEKLFEAEDCYRKTIEISPEHLDAHYLLGNILQEQGNIQDADISLKHALKIKPDHMGAFSTLLFTLNYHPDKTQSEIFASYTEFNKIFCLPHQNNWKNHTNSRNLNRPLNIAYVAPNYLKHPARFFLEPLLSHHDKRSFKIFAFVDMPKENASTDFFAPYVDEWISVKDKQDHEICESIRTHKIDILIDLSGHTAGSKLMVFAQRPAPVSMHWLDFGYTTGLTAIDYYLTDNINVPPEHQKYFSEKLWALETPAFAYRPPKEAGNISALPAIKNKYITFGTLTRAVRINHKTIDAWSKILKRIPDSRLIINSSSFSTLAMQTALSEKFVQNGIHADRLDIAYQSPPWDILQKIDISLDCFPHNSGTTLFESLYMGIPFITLADRPSVGRLGSSILEGVGHPEWIAKDVNEYIDLAVTLSTDTNKLSTYRTSLRRVMENSPLMDESAFAKKFENACKQMFSKWCKTYSKNKISEKMQNIHRSGKPSSAEIKKLTKLFNSGQQQKATTIARSLTSRFPEHGFGWKLLGPLLFQQKITDEAISAMKQAIHCLPDDPDVYNNLGIAFEQLKRLEEAVPLYCKAIELSKNNIQAMFNLGNIYTNLKQPDKALNSYQNVLRVQANNFETICNIGLLYKKTGDLKNAVEYFKKAIQIRPDAAEPLNNLSLIYTEQGYLEKAEDACTESLAINPDLPEANNNLGLIYQKKNLLKESEMFLRKAITLRRDYSTAHCNLGTTLIKKGQLKEAEQSLRKAITLAPDDSTPYGNLLFVLNNHPDKSAEEIYSDYQAYNQRFGIPFQKEWIELNNNPDSNRRLKVGYVCYNFHKHSTQHFLEPLLENHDKNKIELYCYTDLIIGDQATERYKSFADHWVQIHGLSDAIVADRIRSDKIDILIDISGHTENNRLGVFARKPAPVSLHWLDFGYTTGLTAIDYYLTDPITVPPESADLFSETPWQLETPSVVFRPAKNMGEVSPLPALKNDYVTFGTLTRVLRINHKTIDAWVTILQQVQHSHLIIDSVDFKDPKRQQAMISEFTKHGIEEERLEIGFHSPPWDILRQIDIGLDCFPHNSGTTLNETIFMGSPFITLADRPSVGRLGSSILHSIGHSEWVATNVTEYISIATSLASDLPQLSLIRKKLRQEMIESPLMDEKGFAVKVEQAFLEMFEKWVINKSVPIQDEQQQLISKCLQKAQHCFESNLFDEAKELFLLILKIEPDHPEANYHLGNVLLATNPEDTSALVYFEAAVNGNPQNRTYWLSYIDTMDTIGDSKVAYELLDLAINAGLDGEETESLKKRLRKTE